jgi:hypothetical protein
MSGRDIGQFGGLGSHIEIVLSPAVRATSQMADMLFSTLAGGISLCRSSSL